MKHSSRMLPCLVLAAGLFAGTALATDPITLTIDATKTGYAIPANYVGLSFSRDSISGDGGYEQLFNSSKDTYYSHLTNLLAQIGVKHLRTISGTAATNDPDPSGAQDDKFFGFARDSGVTSIIYSLHLFNEEGNDDLVAACHIWTTPADKALLESFALDNESDWKAHYRSPYPDPVITGYATPAGNGYKDKWALLYTNIQNYLGNPSPAAPFSGPDTGSNYPIQTDSASDTSIPYPGGVPFTLRCAIDQASRLKTATQHYYYGNPGTSLVQTATIALSPDRLTEWNTLYANSLAGTGGWPSGLPFRLTESSPFLNDSGNPGGQVFATALWGLDYFCWWARHGCAGINPFTRVVQYNSPIFQLSNNDFVAEPYAYGMKAFGLAGQGTTINAAGFQISNPNNINLTSYGVIGTNDLYVTIINKTFNTVGSHDAAVTISQPTGFTPTSARYIVLTSGSDGDATATSATLGGATIPTSGSWNGTWNSLTVTNGACSLTVPAATAVIVDLHTDGPPLITGQPQSQTVSLGQSVTLSVIASGSAPLSYQWQFNGSGLPGATASVFTLASAWSTNAGLYSVVVTNPLGAVVSSNAVLAVTAVSAWGDNSLAQLNMLAGFADVIAIAAGAWHSLALRADGTVVAWGDDSDGQCDVPATLPAALAIAGGGYHSLALRADGTVAAWGADDSGQTNVPAGLANVMGISAGTWHSLALRRDGTVVAWGDNTWGQTNVPAGLSNVVAVAAGGSHSLALQTNGTVVAWGDNTDAEGNFVGQSIVPANLTNVVAIGAGEYHSLAVRADGTVAAWGDDSQGQCDVPVGLSNVVAVAGGGAHSLALEADGTVVAWGANWNGQCNLPSDLSDAVGISAGEYHSLALLAGSIPVPQLLRPVRQGSRFSVLFQTLNRMNYALEYENSLAASNWTALPAVSGNGVLRLLVDPAATGAQRFYRVQQW